VATPLSLGFALGVAAFLTGGCDQADDRSRADQARAATAGRPVTLGRARLPDRRLVTLSAVTDGAGPCLRLTGLPGGVRACGRAPSERVPAGETAIGGPAIVRTRRGARLELYGETAPGVRRVLVRYRHRDGRATAQGPATLIRVTDPARLRAAGIRAPFGYFVGFAPPGARRVVAEARGPSGARLGLLRFDRIARSMHPRVFILLPPPR
jgi:hypothetical protein